MARVMHPHRRPHPHHARRQISAEQALYDNLRNVLHLSNVGAAAFLGNFKIESSFNPNAYNAGENAHGFAQWENGRWLGAGGLQGWAHAHGFRDATSTQAEIAFLDHELTGPYRSVLEQVRGTNNVYTAAQIVQSQYEGSTPDSLGARQAAAAGILGQISHGHRLTGGARTAPTAATGTGHGAAAGWSIPGGLGGAIPGITPSNIPGVSDLAGQALSGIGHWLERGLFIIGGAILVVLALWLVAKSASASANDRQDDENDNGGQEQAEKAAGAHEAAEAAAAG